MSIEIRKVMTTDSRTVISMFLTQPDEDGADTAVDLTGLSGAIQFEMYNAATDANTIPTTTTGVTFSADATGQVNYQFATPMAIAAGVYHGFFVLTVSGKTDHFPIEPGLLRIEISSHTVTALDAYIAAGGT